MRRVMSGMDCGTSSGITNEFDDDGLERRTQEDRRSKERSNLSVHGLDKRGHRSIPAFWGDVYHRGSTLFSTIVYIQFV